MRNLYAIMSMNKTVRTNLCHLWLSLDQNPGRRDAEIVEMLIEPLQPPPQLLLPQPQTLEVEA